MNRLRRWYNQNTKNIWILVGVVAIIIIGIQLVNSFYKRENEELLNNTVEQNTDINSSYNNITIGDERSSLTGDKLSEGQKTEIGTIDQFISYCNEQDIESAYNLLTDECKEEMYPELQNFQNSYYDEVFAGAKKNVSVENWTSNIYKIEINEDFLSTGVYSKENTMQDYITVEKYEDEYKLNINGYIGRKEKNDEKEENNIKMTVKEVNSYMDYETYKIEITNNSENTILLDDGVDINAMYIEDTNDVKYSAYTHEINSAELRVSPRETKTISIKYYSRYISSKDINRLVFSRMVLDYDSYSQYTNKSAYTDYGEFRIEI